MRRTLTPPIIMSSASTNSSINQNHSKKDFVHHFNSKNAKFLSSFIVLGFVLYHSILRLAHGIDSCKWLLSDGNFRDLVYQPYGCMIHKYSHLDSGRCLKYQEYWGNKNHFVFIGDSRTEQIYHSFIQQISSKYQGLNTVPPKTSYSDSSLFGGPFIPLETLGKRDLSYNDTHLGLKVQFFWNPSYADDSMISYVNKWKSKSDRPQVIVLGGAGLNFIKKNNFSSPLIKDQLASIFTHIVVNLDKMVEMGARVLWIDEEPVNEEKLSKDELELINNEKIDIYNDAAHKFLRYSKADVWSSAKLIALENINETPDGYHLGPKTLFHDAQILLNMYCNDNMNHNDQTCCSSSESVSKLQIVTFAFLGASFVLALLNILKRIWCGSSLFGGKSLSKRDLVNAHYNGYGHEDPYALSLAMLKVPLIMAFFFICDRTTMFMKENKYFTQTNFWLPVIYIIVLGIFFSEDSSYTKVLHYDQENETRGWMVLLILCYEFLGASKVLPIYMFVKILYSAFLFLHGWSQFSNYMTRGDYTVVRLLQELVRLNLMTVLLCLCMNRPYQFYEFVPLISFWTLVAYVILSIPPRITWAICDANSLNYLYLVLKLVGLFSFVTILYISEVFFEKVFVTRPWKALFVTTDDDIISWWTRWKIDRYSMPCGMLLAFGYHIVRKYKILEDDNHGNLFSTRISLSAILFSIFGIVGYGTFSLLCRNQLECVEIHSYVNFLPITSYIILRNVSGMLRTRFSSFFAWFGQIYLELMVGSSHVWMGADGSGVLVLVPAYPVGNVLLTAFVFASTAHEIRKCTDTLLFFIVPDDWRKALRNMLLFLLILIPIGIHDGMF